MPKVCGLLCSLWVEGNNYNGVGECVVRIDESRAVTEPVDYKNNNVVNSKEAVRENRDLLKPEDEKGQDIGQQPLVELLRSEYDINFQLNFSFHKETERLVVQVIDPETSEVIRQIPPQELLELAVKLQEMIGFLIDQRV